MSVEIVKSAFRKDSEANSEAFPRIWPGDLFLKHKPCVMFTFICCIHFQMARGLYLCVVADCTYRTRTVQVPRV